MGWLNRMISLAGGAALIIASAVLSWSVVVRYFVRAPTPWQDETAIFLIVGTVFLSAAAVQADRGHVGIELMGSLLSPRADRVRRVLVDFASLLFCAFFAWKSWTLWQEAWVDDFRTSSTWGPPLWVPYGLMSVGMTLLPVQILLQIIDTIRGKVRT
jgi:TRAP-type C4-dicarboxylate transport system permease small subunit